MKFVVLMRFDLPHILRCILFIRNKKNFFLLFFQFHNSRDMLLRIFSLNGICTINKRFENRLFWFFFVKCEIFIFILFNFDIPVDTFHENKRRIKTNSPKHQEEEIAKQEHINKVERSLFLENEEKKGSKIFSIFELKSSYLQISIHIASVKVKENSVEKDENSSWSTLVIIFFFLTEMTFEKN